MTDESHLRVVHNESTAESAPTSRGYWTADDAAAYLQVSKGWIWKQVRLNNGFPFIRIGERNVRFSKAAIDAWVAQRAVNSTAAQG
jgi:excisionase family DNA binding protein